MSKLVFVTWHYTTHGAAYLKHILSEFHRRGELPKERIDWKELSQVELQAYFDAPRKRGGLVFDEVLYLTAEQAVFDRISNRKRYREEMLKDSGVIAAGLSELWSELLARHDIRALDYSPNMEEDFEWVRRHYPKHFEVFARELWRDMQHYNIKDQVRWLTLYSNARHIYDERRFKNVATGLTSLRDARLIAECAQKVLQDHQKRNPGCTYVINISLGSNQSLVAWYALAQAGLLDPERFRFIETYDDKANTKDQRFKRFDIHEVPIYVFEQIQPKPIFSQTKSLLRRMADFQMKQFMSTGFMVLLLGERGTGKSELVSAFSRGDGDKAAKFVSANCASFEDDSKAEAELFGYVKGAFTGAVQDTPGLFQEANGGVLFLDEVHLLSKRVQGKMMKALQTDRDNFFKIRRLGAKNEERVKCTVVLASNKTVKELRETYLYEDFFDRISQQVIELPPLRDTPEDRRTDWERIWEQMRFHETAGPAPCEDDFLRWLRSQPLHGNFRDLQKIALYRFNYMKMDENLKGILRETQNVKNGIEYAKQEFERLQSKQSQAAYFSTEKSIQDIEADFHRDLSEWLQGQFGSIPKASQYFKEKFGKTIQTRTLYKWKNGK